MQVLGEERLNPRANNTHLKYKRYRRLSPAHLLVPGQSTEQVPGNQSLGRVGHGKQNAGNTMGEQVMVLIVLSRTQLVLPRGSGFTDRNRMVDWDD